MEYTDEELYMRFINGDDEEAVKTLFERYRRALTLFIDETVLHNPYDAEELMMDCFAAVISKTTRYKGRHGASFKTWLYGMARHKAISFLRKRSKEYQPFEESEEIASDKALPEDDVVKKDIYEKLHHAMEGLPDDYRLVLYLKFFEQMKPEEIAGVMNKSIKQIYNLTDRGKERLKSVLEDGGFTWDM